jgi:hypothetical protein
MRWRASGGAIEGSQARMSAAAPYESRTPPSVSTDALLVTLLVGNLTGALGAYLEDSFVDSGAPLEMALLVAVVSLAATALLCLQWGLRKGRAPWWAVISALDILQFARLVPAVAAIGTAGRRSIGEALAWGLGFVTFFALLAALGVIVTARELARARRRRLVRP